MFPENLRKLLEQRVNSIEKLEIVVAFAPRDRSLTAAELEATLPIGRDELRHALEELTKDGILATNASSYQIAADCVPDIEQLMSRYRDDRVQVLSMLTAIAMERIRG